MWARDQDEVARREAAVRGRLLVKPRDTDITLDAPRGLNRLGGDEERDGLLYVPETYTSDRPAPLVLLLHGAGGNAQQGLSLLMDQADMRGLLLLAVDSRMTTWDVIAEGYGPDVARIENALDRTFEQFAVRNDRVAIGGFSDGASYALSLGIINGDLFSHIFAFSPGFMAPTEHHGEPRIFISHGIKDPVLPIDRCSRTISPQLKQAGYDLQYHEFDGGHTITGEIVREALKWFLEN